MLRTCLALEVIQQGRTVSGHNIGKLVCGEASIGDPAGELAVPYTVVTYNIKQYSVLRSEPSHSIE